MSLLVMNWAWRQKFKPSTKLVLMAIADNCDDTGYCWPSIKTIAIKTSLSGRSVIRIIATLKANGVLRIEKRKTANGYRTSNGYYLFIHKSNDTLTSKKERKERDKSRRLAKLDDISVTLTTNKPTIETLPPQPTENGDGVLIFPNVLTNAEKTQANLLLDGIPTNIAQQLLDELAGRSIKTEVKYPLAYLRTLIKKTAEGAFVPEVGIRIAESRAAEQLHRKGLSEAPSQHVKVMQGVADSKQCIAQMRAVLAHKNKQTGSNHE